MKERLLRTITAAREREAELAGSCGDAEATPGGRWSAKDHLAHLSWWRSRNADLMDAVRTGATMPPSVEDDAQNAVVHAEWLDRPTDEIKAAARASWDRVEAAVAACSEEDLQKPHPYADGFRLWQSVPGNGHGHVGQHLMFWSLDNGDEERAEAAQVWVRDLDHEAFPDAESMANADYNLACLYARVGKIHEALPLLAAGFEGRPALVELARTDPDLDRIRDEPGLRRLLAS